MTHDRLCYANADCEANETYLCDLIAIVRWAERDAAVNRVQALGCDITYFSGVAQLESISRAKAIAAIRGDQPGETPVLERFILALTEAIKGDQT